MSHNQSRGERSESTQYRRTGRSVSSNQQRQFSGIAATKGGGGSSAPTNPPNRSFKKYNSNAPVGQLNERSPNLDNSNLPAARSVENGAYQQQPTQRVSDAPVISNTPNVEPLDAPTQNFARAVPRAPSSNVSSAAIPSNVSGASSESGAPKTPEKGDSSKSFPLQFGSISPGFMNGMQIPARTSSAPPNLDEQRKAKARHESLRTAPAAQVPSDPNQHLAKKIGPPSTGETQQAPKHKRDPQVVAGKPVAQAQKPSMHPNMTGIPMQLPFHQPQVPVQLGGPNPQLQSQTMPGTSLPMPMPLPHGNQPLQHSMFVPGLQPHPMQSQGMMHQGQSFNFSSQMGPQLPPQMGSIGMNMPPQFSPQPPVKYSGLRKTVKITHPDTHEELKLDSSPNPRLHHNVQSQTQPISSFPSNMPMNFYPNSYNASSIFFPPTASVPLSNTQVPSTSQPPRLYNQVTVKPPISSYGDKEPLPPTSSVVGKSESSKSSRLQGEDLPKEANTLSSSSLQQAKPSFRASPASAASAGPAITERNGAHVSASAPMEGSTSASTSSSMDVRVGLVVPDPVEDMHKRISSTGQPDQVGGLSTSVSSVPSQLPKAEEKSISSGSIVVSEGKESKPQTVGEDEQRNATSEGWKHCDHSLETSLRSISLESPKITGTVEEPSDQEVTTSSSDTLEKSQEEQEGDDVKVKVNLAAPTHSSVGLNTESAVSAIHLPVRDDIDYSNKSFSVPQKINDPGEISVEKYSEQEPAPVSVPSFPEDALKSENEEIVSTSGQLVSPSPSICKDKVGTDADVAKSAVPRGKKKKKDLYKKAEAAGPSSDLYMAYKGPKEKKESVNQAEGSENSLSVGEKQKCTDVPENTVPLHQPSQSKVEPDDWEDAAEISTQLETSENENQHDVSDNELSTKKYSRDFLLKFVELCTDLPDGFVITADIADSLVVSSLKALRETHPSPVRDTERHGGGSRVDRRASGLGDEDKWSKYPGPLMPGVQGDMWMNPGYVNNVVGFRPGQGGNYGALRNPRAQAAVQYAGGILAGPMQFFGPQSGLQRNNSDSDRWQRATGFQKGLMPSPHTPMQVMHKAEKKYEVGKATDEEELKQRQLKGILNKLTPQNFEKLFQQVKEVNIDNVITLSGVISQIFDKALMEPTFCEMYANFCFHLAQDLPDLTVEGEKITFKRLLLNKCQEEFERGEREEQEANKVEEEGEVKQTAEEREDKRLKARRRMLGNIRLIGELYKKRMLTERIMHECINKLLGEYHNPDEENIEALCKLMSTIGEMIDHAKAKGHIDALFNIMAQLSNNMKLSSRVRFMLKDAIDLRKNKWQQRRKVEGPKKIEEVHRDAAQERHAQTSRLSRAPSIGNPARRGPPPMEFSSRSPSMLSSPGPQLSGLRGVPPHLRGGYGTQDARVNERHASENARTMPIPLPQRSLGDDVITLGPQGGLARGMAFRGQPNISLAEMPNAGDARRFGSGQNGFSSIPQRSTYGQREDVVPKYMPDNFSAQSYDQSHPQERDIAFGNREVGNPYRTLDRSLPTSPRARGGQLVSTQNLSSDKVWPEEYLRDKSMATIKEFYSARDEKEVALCIKDLNTPSFHPSMISIWVADSFERKDMERDLLTKLLINLTKPQDGMISEDQLVQGFVSVLELLEDAVNDAPKAAEFLGRIFAGIILENVIPLSTIEKLIYEGGEEPGRLVEIGLAAEVLGSILDIIKSEKGDSELNKIRSSSKLQLEKFRPPGSNKALRIDKFMLGI
ncbi:Eukaryotic translation initiation factor 4G [Striga hermonthica]|uniref:Eukaryotic translation initiation factor 4G n=1 Tax=Striga hermonthica TaxID=68872 RepID=A0A9N7P1I4_STRHE|nr:Eukaryotic translation initiation factor 4G [Striga hermonthica]